MSMRGAQSPPDDILDRPEAGGRVIRGGAIRSITYLAGTVLAGIAVPLMTRHLGLVDFGRFVTASSVVMVVAGVTEFGLSGVGTRDYALAPPEGRQPLLSNLLGLRTALTTAGLLVAALLMVLAHYPGIVISGMLISGLGLVLLNAEQTYAIALNVELRWGAASLFETINALVVGLGTVLLVVLGAHLFSFFWVSVVSSAAALIAAMYYLRSRVSLRPRFDAAQWRSVLRDTLPYAAAVTVGTLYPRIGLIATSAVSGAHQTGYYSTAFKVVEVLGGFGGLLVGSAFPIFARAGRDDHERLRYATGRVGETTLIVGVYLALSLCVAAPFIVRVLAPPSFAPAVPVLRLQALALLGSFAATTWGTTLLSLRLHGAILRSTAVGLLTTLAVSAALVPLLGARGASIASAAAEFVVAGAYLRALVRRHPHLRPSYAIVPRLLIISLVAAAPGLLLPLPSLALWMISSAIFGVLAWRLRIVPEEIVQAFVDRVRKPRSRREGSGGSGREGSGDEPVT